MRPAAGGHSTCRGPPCPPEAEDGEANCWLLLEDENEVVVVLVKEDPPSG